MTKTSRLRGGSEPSSRSDEESARRRRPSIIFGIGLHEFRASAGKCTLNRLEHAPHEGSGGADRHRRIGHDGAAIAELFVDLFVEAHERPPAQITLDLDATDDPIHGS